MTTRFITELKHRRVFRVAAVYAAVGFVVLQAARGPIAEQAPRPRRMLRMVRRENERLRRGADR
jgi:hypothetical protein